MSTLTILQEAVRKEKLCFLELQVPSDPVRRRVLLHPEIARDFSRTIEIPRMFELQGELEAFVTGQHMTMSLTPYKHKTARIGLLDPVDKGFCDIRCRHHSPGIRVLGRFALQDWFVAMEWRPRSEAIGGMDKVPLSDQCAGDEWLFATLEVEQRWDAVIPGAGFVTGDNLHDYISENCSRIGA